MFKSEADQASSIPLRYRYDVALLYLRQADYDVDAAVETFKADEKWEKEHPMEVASKGKAGQSSGRKRFGIGGGLTGQIS